MRRALDTPQVWQSHNVRMASPFRKDQLSPEMVQRYGMDVRPWGTWALIGGLVLAFVAALAFVTVSITGATGGSQLLAWESKGPDHASVTFSIRRKPGQALQCAVRGQDATRVDVGYAVIDIPPGPASSQQVFDLRTIAPAVTVEVLGCAEPGALDVDAPQFPPGVVPPAQPWSP